MGIVHRCKNVLIASAAAILATAIAAGAQDDASSPVTWKNSKLEWQYYAYGGPYDGLGSPSKCTVIKNNCGSFGNYFHVVTDSKSITFNYKPSGMGGKWSSSKLSLPPTIHNGIAINLLSAGTFTSVKIDRATNMAGFNGHHLSFTAKQIQVDWQNLEYDSSTIVKLDVKVAPSAVAAGVSVTDNPPRPDRGQE